MPTFSYIARNRSGRISRGQLEATTPVDLRSRLNAMELHLVSVNMLPTKFGLHLLSQLSPSRWLPVRPRDIEMALQQLAIMLRSGLRLLDALKALQMQANRVAMARLLESLHQAVSNGDSLSKAMSAHRSIPQIVAHLVAVGEQTGCLEKVLMQAKEHLSQRRSVISEVRFALAYPTVVTIAAISIAAYLVLVVIPQLQTFLNAMGRKLPAITQTLVDLAQWLQVYGANLVVGVCLLLGCLAAILYVPKGRLAFDRFLLRIPVVGNILRLAGTSGLAGSLALMMQSGVRLVDAIKVAAQLQSNRYLAAQLQVASQSVSVGQPLAPSLSTQDAFSPILGSMVEVAERAGHLNMTLDEVASYCNTELKSRIKRMTQLIEPVVILIAGSIVGYVYIAFFIALMSAGGNFR